MAAPRTLGAVTRCVAAALIVATATVPLRAQDRAALSLDLPVDSLLSAKGPNVRATGMLAGDRIRSLLLAGFPARFHFRVELWTEGRIFFDHLENATEWDVWVRYLPIERRYEVLQVQNDQPLSLGKFAEIGDAEHAIARPYAAPIAAIHSSRLQYYQTTLVVEVLSERDLDELSRWLQGDVEPGITGHANPASILSRGIRTLASRLLGGEKREYERTSRHFRVP